MTTTSIRHALAPERPKVCPCFTLTDAALEEIIFRAEHGVLQSLAPYPGEQRVAMLPSVVRMLLTTFLEELIGNEPI